LLPELQACTRLRVRWANGGETPEPGSVYLARPGTSLLCLADGTLALAPFGVESTALNPVDSFLTSAATCHQDRLLALVLAGFERDGASGCGHVKREGGNVLVLDRATAQYLGLAEPIVRTNAGVRVLTIVELGEVLRGCFTSRDLLAYAEIQIQLAKLLETAMQSVGTPMGHITQRFRKTDTLRIVVQRGLGIDYFERFEGLPIGCDTAWCQAVRFKHRVVIPDVTREPAHPGRELSVLRYKGELALPLLTVAPRVEAHGALTMLFPHAYETAGRGTDIERLAQDASQLIVRLP